MDKKRVIPKVPKEERTSIEYGYHSAPLWLVVLCATIIIVGWITLIFH